eukprot:6410236-Heterocapsa_arctica.AAC.1
MCCDRTKRANITRPNEGSKLAPSDLESPGARSVELGQVNDHRSELATFHGGLRYNDFDAAAPKTVIVL